MRIMVFLDKAGQVIQDQSVVQFEMFCLNCCNDVQEIMGRFPDRFKFLRDVSFLTHFEKAGGANFWSFYEIWNDERHELRSRRIFRAHDKQDLALWLYDKPELLGAVRLAEIVDGEESIDSLLDYLK